MMEVLCFGYLVPFHHLPPVLGEPLRVPFLQLGVCQGSRTSRSGQDAGERHLGTGGSSRHRLLQLTVSGAEGDGGVASHD